MLDYLKDKKEVGFFQSIQALMQTCRWVLGAGAVSSSRGYFRFKGCSLSDPGNRDQLWPLFLKQDFTATHMPGSVGLGLWGDRHTPGLQEEDPDCWDQKDVWFQGQLG